VIEGIGRLGVLDRRVPSLADDVLDLLADLFFSISGRYEKVSNLRLETSVRLDL
jgi:hypothetical protein